MVKTKKILYLDCTENALKFHALNYLRNGDSVLVDVDTDGWINFFYSKPIRYGKWQLNKTETGTGPSLLFTDNIEDKKAIRSKPAPKQTHEDWSWYTNGLDHIKLHKHDDIPEGYYLSY